MFSNHWKRNLAGNFDETMIATMVPTKLKKGLIPRIKKCLGIKSLSKNFDLHKACCF